MRLHLIVIGLYIAIASAFVLGSSVSLGNSCNYTIQNSNTNYFINSACSTVSVTFSNYVSNSSLTCQNGTTFGGNSTFAFLGNNNNDSIYSCGFSGTHFYVHGNVKANIIGASSANIVPIFLGKNSNVTVGYYLNISVFNPYGYNSMSLFGDRVAAFAWIVPLLNNTINVHDTELQMSEFYNKSFDGVYDGLAKIVPFGVYGGYNGLNGTQIFAYNGHNYSYGKIIGSKRFLLAAYTIYPNKTVNYNPYEIDYSFLAFDQLVMFRLNITHNYNLIPFYIEPIYPRFNFYILPDNGTRNFTIKWLVAVPPQDHNWNFSVYVYRYRYNEFTVNPTLGIGNHSSLVDLLNYPSNSYQKDINGTEYYFLNYTSMLGLGLNSSIIMAPGTIPGVGNFIEDSTTPSFSLGLGLCSTYYNESQTAGNLVVNYSGTYDMVNNLEPLFQPGIPGLVSGASCGIGIKIMGKNITINCKGGNINDTDLAAIVSNSKNVVLKNCDIYGNGIAISNSSNVTMDNMKFFYNPYSRFAYNIQGSSNVNIYNSTFGEGFVDPILTNNSRKVSFSGIVACTRFNATALQSELNITGLSYICNASQASQALPSTTTSRHISLDTKDTLYAGAIILAIIYVYLFLKLQYKPEKSKRRKKG